MIELVVETQSLVKRYGRVTPLDGLTMDNDRPSKVTRAEEG